MKIHRSLVLVTKVTKTSPASFWCSNLVDIVSGEVTESPPLFYHCITSSDTHSLTCCLVVSVSWVSFEKKKKKNAVCWVTVQTFPSSLYIKSHDSWGPLKAGGGNLLPLSDGLVVNVWGFMPLNKNYVTLSPCGRISVSLGGLNRPSPPQLSCGVSRFVPVIQSQTHTTSDLAHAWFT